MMCFSNARFFQFRETTSLSMGLVVFALASSCSAFAVPVSTDWDFEISVKGNPPTPDAASKIIVAAASVFGSVKIGTGQDTGNVDKAGYALQSRITGAPLLSRVFDNLSMTRQSSGRFVNGIALTSRYADKRGRSAELTMTSNFPAKRYEFAKGGVSSGSVPLNVAASDLAMAPYAFLGKPVAMKSSFLAFTDGKAIRQTTLQPRTETMKLDGKVINTVRLTGSTSAGVFELWLRAEDGYPLRMRAGLGANYGATLDQIAKNIPAALVLF
jgi:hypothetical protein